MKPADMTPSRIAQIAMTAERATRTYAHTCTPTRVLRATLIPESSALALHTKQYGTLPQSRVGAQKQEIVASDPKVSVCFEIDYRR